MGESQNTIKIVYNNMTYILFKAEDFIATTLNLDEFNLDIIGKANLNYYGGRYTPQIKIETYELKNQKINSIFKGINNEYKSTK